MTDAATEERGPWRALLAVVSVLLVLAGLAAGAIALEPPTGVASGQVLDEAGRPLAHGRVVFAGGVVRVVPVREDGRFVAVGLPVGEYYISAKAPGHEPQHQENALAIREGQTLGDVEFKLARTRPSLDVTNVPRVCVPNKPVRVMVRGNQVRRLAVALYRLDLAAAAARDPELQLLRSHPEPLRLLSAGLLRAIREWDVPIAPQNHEDEDWFHQPVEVADLSPGAYFVQVSGQPGPDPEGRAQAVVEDSWYFTVGTLAVVAKRGEDGLVAWVTDTRTRAPVAGAEVRVLGPGAPAGSWRTDDRGLVRVPVAGDDRVVTVLAALGGDRALARVGFWGGKRGLDIYGFTDRPVYRPGDRVHLKAHVRRRLGSRFMPVPGRSVRLTWRDAQGDEIARMSRTTGADSAIEAELVLPGRVPLGEHRVDLAIGTDDVESVAFAVEDYRKPELKVELTPTRSRWIRGETAEVAVRAAYYFGAPVPGARLQATVYSAPGEGGASPAEGFFATFLGDDMAPVWGLGDVVQTTELVADAEGAARLSIPLPGPADAASAAREGDRVFTVVVEGQDATGRPVKEQLSFPVCQSDLRVRVACEEALYVGTRSLALRLETTDHAAQPRSVPVAVRLVRLESEERRTDRGDVYWETRRIPLQTLEARTDARGTARLAVPAPLEGSYEVEAEVVDAQGRHAVDLAWTWVAGGGEAPSTYHYGALQLVFDRRVYHPGQTARVLVVSPVADAHVLLTLEGRRLSEPRVVRLRGTTARLDLPVTDSLKPNAHLVATVVNGLEFITAERSLNVLPEDKFLDVAVKPDIPKARPGERVGFTVTTRDWKGRPVSASVALGIVDEAIYAIEPDRTPDIRSFFHGPRWNQVSTAYSFAEDYSGGLDKFGPDPRVRARFEDTAAWFPDLRTGPNGSAHVELTLPDNLTTWIATARAITPDARVGSGRAALVASKDVLVRLVLPRFGHVGDAITIVALSHNYTASPLPLRLALEGTGASFGEPAPVRVVVPPGGVGRAAWPVTLREPGEVAVKVVARTEVPGIEGDALAVTFPARPFGLPDFLPVSLLGGADEARFQVPAGLPGATLTARIQGSPASALREAVAYLRSYPYGCAEQEASRLVPAGIVLPRWRQAGLPERALGIGGPGRELTVGAQRLLASQHADGGWGWWSHDVSRPPLTALVMEMLAALPAQGVELPREPIRRGLERLRLDVAATSRHAHEADRTRRGLGPDVRAHALLALAAWQSAPEDELERLWRERDALTPEGLARFALALHVAGQPQRAERVVAALVARAEQTDALAFWSQEADTEQWLGTATEATAEGLRALVAVMPEAPVTARAARWLMSRNARGYWTSTRDTAVAAWALADWLAAGPRPEVGLKLATLTLDGRAVGTWEPAGGAPDGAPPTWEAVVTEGPHTLALASTGASAALPEVTGGVSFLRDASSLAAREGKGLAVSRRYLSLPPDVLARARGKGPGTFFDDTLANGLAAWAGVGRPGESVLVRLDIRSDRERQWMCVRDPLPGGCEIVSEGAAGWPFWWEHHEYRDEEAVFFCSRLPAGVRSLYYVMRPATPGTWRVLPPQVWAMYDPETQAHGPPAIVRIGE